MGKLNDLMAEGNAKFERGMKRMRADSELGRKERVEFVKQFKARQKVKLELRAARRAALLERGRQKEGGKGGEA